MAVPIAAIEGFLGGAGMIYNPEAFERRSLLQGEDVVWPLTVPIQASDAERLVRERIFNIVAVTVLLALSVGLVSNLFFGPRKITVLTLAGLIAGVAALVAVARRGYAQIASALLPPTILVAISLILVTRDGVRDAAVVAIAATLVVGGVLLSRRAMIALTIAVLLLILGTGYAEMARLLPTRLGEFTDVRYLISVCLAFIAVAVTVRVVAESLVAGLRHAQEKSAALGTSEERYRKLVELSPDGILLTSLKEGRVLEANDAFARITGLVRKDVIGRTTSELGFWRDAHERTAMVVLPTQGGVREYERGIRRPSGQELDVRVRATRIHIQGEDLLLAVVRDVTERRRAERLHGESEALLARMIEASPEAITIATIEDGTFVEVNPAGQRLCGYSREELIGSSAVTLDFYPDPEDRRRIVAELQRSRVVYGRETQLRRKNGEIRDILMSAALVDFRGRELVLFQAIDITERNNAERALREHQELLRELSAHNDSVREGERAHIAREIHDEMGQELTALRMDLSVLGLEFAKTAPEVAGRIQELKLRVDNIIQTVRDVAAALRPAALDFGILPSVEWLVDEFQKRNAIRCSIKVEKGEFDITESRSIVLFRILQESLTNISRHAGARNVEISLKCNATHVGLDVRDDGQGFDVEAVKRKKTFGLLGIRERVLILQGDLSIASEPGKGTRVSVSIPV